MNKGAQLFYILLLFIGITKGAMEEGRKRRKGQSRGALRNSRPNDDLGLSRLPKSSATISTKETFIPEPAPGNKFDKDVVGQRGEFAQSISTEASSKGANGDSDDEAGLRQGSVEPAVEVPIVLGHREETFPKEASPPPPDTAVLEAPKKRKSPPVKSKSVTFKGVPERKGVEASAPQPPAQGRNGLAKGRRCGLAPGRSMPESSDSSDNDSVPADMPGSARTEAAIWNSKGSSTRNRPNGTKLNEMRERAKKQRKEQMEQMAGGAPPFKIENYDAIRWTIIITGVTFGFSVGIFLYLRTQRPALDANGARRPSVVPIDVV